MRTYEQAFELANICARQARLTIDKRVAEETVADGEGVSTGSG